MEVKKFRSIGSLTTLKNKHLFVLLKMPIRIFNKNYKLRFGIVTISFITLLVILEPIINGFRLAGSNPLFPQFKPRLPPSLDHPFGTDFIGRDLLAEVLFGLRYSFLIGIIAGSVSTAIGIVVAFLAGYRGGIYDSILRSLTDMMLVIPTWPILVLISAYVPYMSIYTMSILLAIFTWPWAARSIRPQVMSLKERPYIDLAKITNLGDFEIIFKEILPNTLPYIGVGFSTAVVGSILAETSLSIIGIGPGNIQTLGWLLNWAMNYGAIVMGSTNIVAVPVLFLVLIFASLNMINMGLEEAYNPRLKKITGE